MCPYYIKVFVVSHWLTYVCFMKMQLMKKTEQKKQISDNALDSVALI